MNKRQRKKAIKIMALHLYNVIPIIAQVPKKILYGTDKKKKY